MTRLTRWAIGLATMATLSTSSALAQGTQTAPPKLGQPVKIDVVLERYSTDNKKISSMPFVIWLMTPTTPQSNVYGNLRVGVDVPVGSNVETRTTGAGTVSTTSNTANRVEYRNVGTSIDCYLFGPSDDGRVRVQLTLSDTSIFDPEAQRKAALAQKGLVAPAAQGVLDASSFRTFSLRNELPMRDLQTIEFATATDKVTGEIVKVVVTMTIAK